MIDTTKHHALLGRLRVYAAFGHQLKDEIETTANELEEAMGKVESLTSLVLRPYDCTGIHHAALNIEQRINTLELAYSKAGQLWVAMANHWYINVGLWQVEFNVRGYSL